MIKCEKLSVIVHYMANAKRNNVNVKIRFNFTELEHPEHSSRLSGLHLGKYSSRGESGYYEN